MHFVLSILFMWSTLALAVDLDDLDRRQQILTQKYSELTTVTPTTDGLAKLVLEKKNHSEVRLHLEKIKAFFKEYDSFNLDKIDFFQNEALEHAQRTAEQFLKENGKLTKKMLLHLTNLKQARATYLERKIFFGTERDTERLDIGQDVLHHYGKFVKEIREHGGEKVSRVFGSAKIVPFIDTPKDFIKTFDRFFGLLWSAYFRTQSSAPDKAPIPESLQAIQKRLVKMRNIEVKWEGMDNLQDTSHDGKTVNMFLINHANSFFDTSAQQAFPLKGMSAMGNMDVFFPAFLAKRMVKSNHMISVGHGDIIGKTKELVTTKQLNKFFLAIEGITGTGLYEMRPVLPLFQAAVYEAIKRGLDVQLYPVAFPDNFRLMNDWRNPIEGKIASRGVLLNPLNTAHCLSLLESTGEIDSVAHLIRWAWFSKLNTNEVESFSMPFPHEVARRLELMIWGD